MLRNVLIVGEREDQACVLLHVEQQVLQVEHQQLYALLAAREGCLNIVANMVSSDFTSMEYKPASPQAL